MPLLLVDHMEGCNPLNPCASCRAATFLKSKMSDEDIERLVDIMRGSTIPIPYPDATLIGEVPGLASREVSLLKREGLFTVGDVAGNTEIDLLKRPNLGRRTLRNIIDALHKGRRELKKREE